MNKFLRFTIMLVLIAAAGVLILAFLEPHDVTVTRSVTIRSNRETTFAQIKNLTNWQHWSTLLENDTSLKITYNGNAGEAGSTLEWKGDHGITGEGIIKNTGIDKTKMSYSFSVTKPGTMEADGVFSVTDTGEMVKVTWTFHKHFPFPANAALIVFDLERYMGGDMMHSLAKLKEYVERDAEPAVEIEEVQYPGGILAGIRDTLTWDDMETFFGDTYSLFIKTPSSKLKGSPIGMFYDWDTIRRKADVFAGYPVTDTDIPVNGIIFSELPQTRAFKAVHKGSYETAKKIHKLLDEYVAKKGLSRWITIEEYVVYPGNERDARKWQTNIYVLVQ